MSKRIETLGRKLIDARKRKDEAKIAKTKAEAAFRAAEAELWEVLQEEHGRIKALDIDLGGIYGLVRFTRRETLYAQIVDPEALARAARETGRDQELIKQADEAARKSDFREAPLNELVREALEHDQDLLDGLSFRADRGVTITRKG